MCKKVAAVFCLFLLIFSCKDKKKESKNFDLKSMLKNISTNIITPNYQQFQGLVNEMNTAAATFITTSNAANLAALRAAYKKAYLSWQGCELFEFGPAEENMLRANVNIYPIDTTKIKNNISTASFALDALSNSDAKGFPAIDFLLYGENKSDAQILNEFTAAPHFANRKQYLQQVITTIKTKTDAVVSAWGSYINTFIAADGYSAGSSVSLLVNAMNIHYEKYMRDGKVGIPVGVRSLGIALPKQVEAYYGKFSVELLNASVLAFQNLYLGKYAGTNGLGFDDHLIAFDGTTVDASIQSNLVDIISATTALNDPLSQTIITNQASVEAVFSKMQKLVISLKADMPSKLGILISYQDNDGD